MEKIYEGIWQGFSARAVTAEWVLGWSQPVDADLGRLRTRLVQKLSFTTSCKDVGPHYPLICQ